MLVESLNNVLNFTDGWTNGNPRPTGTGGTMYKEGYNSAPVLFFLKTYNKAATITMVNWLGLRLAWVSLVRVKQ